MLLLSVIMIGCNKKEVPIYSTEQEVKFIDASKGSIMLTNQSSKSDKNVIFSFKISLKEKYMFDDLFSSYSIFINKKGTELRYSNNHSSSENLKTDYIVKINNEEIGFEKLSTYKFETGDSIVSFSFGSNYINNKDSEV